MLLIRTRIEFVTKGGDTLECTLKNIISLDKKATKYKESLDSKLKEEKSKFQVEIIQLNKEFEGNLQREGEQIIDCYLKKANQAAMEMKKNGDIEVNLLREKYENSKQEIVEKIFSTLLKNV